jgi:hypothetical protein
MYKVVTSLVLGSFLLGCGSGSSDEGGNGSQGSQGGTEGVVSSFDGAFLLVIDDGAGYELSSLITSYGNKFYGISTPVIGTLNGSNIVAKLSVSAEQETRVLNIPKYAGALYSGAYKDGGASLAPYGNQNYNQTSLQDTWFLENHSFTIGYNGAFSLLEPQSGCSVEGTITFRTKNIYTVNATASACINGNLEGPVSGAGSIITEVDVMGQTFKLAGFHFVYNNATDFAERHVVLDLKNTN